MNSRTSIVYGTGERVGRGEIIAVQGDVDGRYALHIGWNLSLIADLDQLVRLADNINAAVEAAQVDRYRRLRADATDDDAIADAAVADDDTVMEAIKND
jgi:hypothetical protein